MDILKPLKVFLDKGSQGEHYAQMTRLMEASSRLLSFTLVSPDRGRYAIPVLCDLGQVALWMSPACQFQGDVARLWQLARRAETCCVYVLPDEYDDPNPSLLLFRNKYCGALSVDYLYRATPEQFAPWVWAGGKQYVGKLEV